MKTNRIRILTLMVSAIFLFIGCDDNNSTAPDPFGYISGTVTFNGSWPATGSVSISLQGDWYVDSGQGYPSGYPSASIGGMEIFNIVEADYTEGQAYSYEINDIPFGNYAALVVSWYDPCFTSEADKYDALGAYNGGTHPYFYSAQSFTIDAENRTFTEKNITADLNYATGIDCTN